MSQEETAESLFIQASPGLEGVLEAEAGPLGRVRRVPGGVELDGDTGVHADANLRLRVAERVLLRLVARRVSRWEEAETLLAAAPLDAVAGAGSPVELEVTIRLAGAPAASRCMEILSRAWRRPVSGAGERSGRVPRLVLRVAGEGLTLSADTSGELLHRRGWRQEVSRAPMRETLAAGVLALGGFEPSRPLWDPMCGSGTLTIEAALAARGIAPGLGRQFAAEAWPIAAGVGWAGRRTRLREAVLARAPSPVVATDLNAGSLGTARRNARRAGVAEDVKLERLDLAVADPSGLAPGLLVSNLPYGIRVGAREGLEVLDASLARILCGPFRRWRVALLVDDERRLERVNGRLPDRVEPLRNGGIAVALGVWEV